jgi:hypothetical protein
MLGVLDSSVLEVNNYKKGTPMSKHMAKRGKQAVKHGRAARPLKRARGKKPTRVKKPVARRGRVLGKGVAKLQAFEPEAAQVFEALGQEPESVADVIEVFEVEVMGDGEEIRQSGESDVTL